MPTCPLLRLRLCFRLTDQREDTDWNVDGLVNVGDEYIEILNMGGSSIKIQNWRLDNGGNGGSYYLPNRDLLPRQILVFFKPKQ